MLHLEKIWRADQGLVLGPYIRYCTLAAFMAGCSFWHCILLHSLAGWFPAVIEVRRWKVADCFAVFGSLAKKMDT